MPERINLGKVLVTLEGEHDSTRSYDKYCEVTSGGSSFVSKKDVPIGTPITDTTYWQIRASKGADGTNGVDGNDGEDAYQPFKGWYSSTSELNTSFGTPQVGDYAYIKGASASDPVAIYQCATAGTWTDSGRTFNPANNQEFASGESLNNVRIVNNLNGGSSNVLSAEQGKVLDQKVSALGPKISEVERNVNTILPTVATKENVTISSGGSFSSSVINRARKVCDTQADYQEGDRLLSYTSYNGVATQGGSNNEVHIYVYDGNGQQVRNVSTGYIVEEVGEFTVDLTPFDIVLGEGEVVAVKCVNYSTDTAGAERYYDYDAGDFVSGYKYNFSIQVQRIHTKDLVGQDELDEGLSNLEKELYVEKNVERDFDRSVVYATSFNRTRIVADERVEFHNGDTLTHVWLCATHNTSFTGNFHIYVYGSDKVLKRDVDTGVTYVSNTDGRWLDVTDKNIVLEDGDLVAIKGLLYGGSGAQDYYYDFSSSEYPSYKYTVGYRYKSNNKHFEVLDGEIQDLKDRVEELEDSQKPTNEIKILLFGNSFTQDSFSYVPAMLKNIAPNLNFTIGIAYIGGCPLVQHCVNFTGSSLTLDGTTYNVTNYTYSKFSNTDSKWNGIGSKNVDYMLADEDWDIVTFQQSGSTAFKDWDTYFKPYIYTLQAALFGKAVTIGKTIKMGWVLTHGTYIQTIAGQLERWQQTRDNARKMLDMTGVEVVFPYGTAVQNLRTTSLNAAGVGGENVGFLGDNAHLHEGIGTMVANYVNVLTILHLAGLDKLSIIGEPTRVTEAWNTSNGTLGPNYGTGETHIVYGVTEANVLMAQNAAIMAHKHPFDVCGWDGDTFVYEDPILARLDTIEAQLA